MVDTGQLILYSGHCMVDSGYCIVDTVRWTLDIGDPMVDP